MTVPLPAAGSTSWTAWATQLDAQGRGAQPGPRLHTDYRAKANGSLPAVGDEGTTITNPRNATAASYAPTITSGRLVSNIPGTVAGASYVNQPLTSKVKRLGALFAFTAGDTDGVLALAAWDFDFVTPADSALGGISAHIHFTVGPHDWTFSVVVVGVLTQITNGIYATALPQDGTLLRAEVRIDGSTATLVLPDNTTATVTDSRIGSVTGIVPCWEFYKNTTASCLPTLAATWADTTSDAVGMASPADVARLATATIPYVAVREYIAGAATQISPTGSYAPVSAANLSLNQRAGPTGGILYTMQAWLTITAPGGVGAFTTWGVGLGVGPNASSVGGPEGITMVDPGSTTASQRLVTVTHTRTGAAPGQMFTGQWNHYAATPNAGNYIDLNPAYGMNAVFTATPI